MSSKILTFGGYALTVGNHAVEAAVFTTPMPDNTLRLKFTEGVTPSFSKGTATQVSQSPNIWDLTYNDPDWNKLLYGMSELLEVVSAGNTSAVSSTYQMFYNDSKLTYVAPFDTSNVSTMYSMFNNCYKLSAAPMLDTHNVKTFTHTFGFCRSLSSLPNYDTSNVTNFAYAFQFCSALSSVPTFDTSKATDIGSILKGCSSLTSIPQFNTSSVKYFTSSFANMPSLKTVPLLNTSKATNVSFAFANDVNVSGGALALYNQMKTQTINTISACFRDCGINTQTGSAELAQIQAAWK